MSTPSPEFCNNCERAKDYGSREEFCSHAKKCAKWREWFKKEWRDIREAAKQKGLLKDE